MDIEWNGITRSRIKGRGNRINEAGNCENDEAKFSIPSRIDASNDALTYLSVQITFSIPIVYVILRDWGIYGSLYSAMSTTQEMRGESPKTLATENV